MVNVTARGRDFGGRERYPLVRGAALEGLNIYTLDRLKNLVYRAWWALDSTLGT